MDLSNEVVIHQKGKNIEYLQFRDLLQYPEIFQAYTLRTSGFDIGGNEAWEEHKEEYEKKYEILAKELGIPKERIVRPYQTHTDQIKQITKEDEVGIFPPQLKEVDGLLTKVKGIGLSLSYADCIALLFYDPVEQVVANIHSGWKGTLQRIGQKAVKQMKKEYDCKAKNIRCYIGPSIRSCHFEVGEEVVEVFRKEFSNLRIVKEEKKKYWLDTAKLNEEMLTLEGIAKEHIFDSGLCTVCHQNQFHSYRGAGKSAGRNTAIIGIREK